MEGAPQTMHPLTGDAGGGLASSQVPPEPKELVVALSDDTTRRLTEGYPSSRGARRADRQRRAWRVDPSADGVAAEGVPTAKALTVGDGVAVEVVIPCNWNDPEPESMRSDGSGNGFPAKCSNDNDVSRERDAWSAEASVVDHRAPNCRSRDCVRNAGGTRGGRKNGRGQRSFKTWSSLADDASSSSVGLPVAELTKPRGGSDASLSMSSPIDEHLVLPLLEEPKECSTTASHVSAMANGPSTGNSCSDADSTTTGGSIAGGFSSTPPSRSIGSDGSAGDSGKDFCTGVCRRSATPVDGVAADTKAAAADPTGSPVVPGGRESSSAALPSRPTAPARVPSLSPRPAMEASSAPAPRAKDASPSTSVAGAAAVGTSSTPSASGITFNLESREEMMRRRSAQAAANAAAATHNHTFSGSSLTASFFGQGNCHNRSPMLKAAMGLGTPVRGCSIGSNRCGSNPVSPALSYYGAPSLHAGNSPWYCPFDYIMVLDFEATCDECVTADHLYEIIEFPVVLVDTKLQCCVAEFHRYVKPRTNPTLSEFCKQLTGIKQEDVDAASSLEEVLKQFDRWVQSTVPQGSRIVFATDGQMDLREFMYVHSYSRQGIRFPNMFFQWIDVKRSFAHVFQCQQGKIKAMLDALGCPFEGRLHSGLDDARNIAQIVIALLQHGCSFCEVPLSRIAHPTPQNSTPPSVYSTPSGFVTTPYPPGLPHVSESVTL